MVPGGIASGVVLGLVLAGKDMGTAIVLAIIVCRRLLDRGRCPLRFFGMAALSRSASARCCCSSTPHGLAVGAHLRVAQPRTCDTKGDCMQTTHGTWALASGGLWGLGPGMSREKWGYLPAADYDFIFAIIGEEFGLIGTLLVLFAFAMMVVAVNRIVHRTRDPFVQIAGGAIGAWIIGQACINIAVVLGLAARHGRPTAAGVLRRLVAHRLDGRHGRAHGLCARRTRRARGILPRARPWCGARSPCCRRGRRG